MLFCSFESFRFQKLSVAFAVVRVAAGVVGLFVLRIVLRVILRAVLRIFIFGLVRKRRIVVFVI